MNLLLCPTVHQLPEVNTLLSEKFDEVQEIFSMWVTSNISVNSFVSNCRSEKGQINNSTTERNKRGAVEKQKKLTMIDI